MIYYIHSEVLIMKKSLLSVFTMVAMAAENDIMFCKKSKQVKDGKCRSFKYDPLLRMPNVTVFKTDFSAKDFKL